MFLRNSEIGSLHVASGCTPPSYDVRHNLQLAGHHAVALPWYFPHSLFVSFQLGKAECLVLCQCKRALSHQLFAYPSSAQRVPRVIFLDTKENTGPPFSDRGIGVHLCCWSISPVRYYKLLPKAPVSPGCYWRFQWNESSWFSSSASSIWQPSAPCHTTQQIGCTLVSIYFIPCVSNAQFSFCSSLALGWCAARLFEAQWWLRMTFLLVYFLINQAFIDRITFLDFSPINHFYSYF